MIGSGGPEQDLRVRREIDMIPFVPPESVRARKT